MSSSVRERSRSLRESASDWLPSEPSPLVTITTRAPELSLVARARVRSSGPRTFTPQTCSRGAWYTPALLTRTSRAGTRAASFAIESGEETSICSTRAPRSEGAERGLRTPSNTVYPSRDSSRATSRPIPRLAPVTSAVGIPQSGTIRGSVFLSSGLVEPQEVQSETDHPRRLALPRARHGRTSGGEDRDAEGRRLAQLRRRLQDGSGVALGEGCQAMLRRQGQRGSDGDV